MPKTQTPPSVNLQNLQDRVSKISRVVGIDFFDPHPKPNMLTFVTTVISISWQALVWYTAMKNLPNLDVLCLAFVHVSFFSQGVMRTLNLVLNPHTTTNLQSSMLDFYKFHESDNDVRVILEQALKRTKQLTYGIIIFDCVIFNSGIVLLMVFILTRAYVLFVPIYLPYINAKELAGYLLNLTLQLALGAVGFFAFATYDATILICGYHNMTMTEILVMRMRMLQEEMDVEERRRKFDDERKVGEKFISIIEFHQQLRSFNMEFTNLVKIPFVTAIVVNIIGLALCINMGLRQSLSLAIGASIGLFVQLLLPFIVAVMQSFQKEQIRVEATAFSWDKFRERSSKENYQHFLNISRSHQGIARTLDMNLFSRILAVAYCVVVNFAAIISWCEAHS